MDPSGTVIHQSCDIHGDGQVELDAPLVFDAAALSKNCWRNLCFVNYKFDMIIVFVSIVLYLTILYLIILYLIILYLIILYLIILYLIILYLIILYLCKCFTNATYFSH